MRYLKIFGVSLVAVFGPSVIAAASAQAVEVGILSALPQKFSVSGSAQTLKSLKAQLTCTSVESVGTNEFTTKDKGTTDLLFLGCTTEAGAVKCTGNEDTTKGSMLLISEVSIVTLKLASKLLLGIRVKIPTSFSFKCGTLTDTVTEAVMGEATLYAKTAGGTKEAVPMPAVGTGETLEGEEVVDVFREAAAKEDKQEIEKCAELEAVCGAGEPSLMLKANLGLGSELAVQEGTVTLKAVPAGTKVKIDY